jgi:hypothetical protein
MDSDDITLRPSIKSLFDTGDLVNTTALDVISCPCASRTNLNPVSFLPLIVDVV